MSGSDFTLVTNAGTAHNGYAEHTLRGIPPEVDNALRARARAARKSLNEAAIDALAKGAGLPSAPRKRCELGDIAGAWKADKASEAALADRDRVDQDLWRRGLLSTPIVTWISVRTSTKRSRS